MIDEVTDEEYQILTKGKERCRSRHPVYFKQLLDLHIEGRPPCRECREATERELKGGTTVHHVTQ